MAGNVEGGIKAAKTNMERYGKNYYAEMGRKGGLNGHSGGFASSKELAREAGRKGGSVSHRGESMQKKLDTMFDQFIRDKLSEGESIHSIAVKIGVADSTVKRFALRHKLITGYTEPKKYY